MIPVLEETPLNPQCVEDYPRVQIVVETLPNGDIKVTDERSKLEVTSTDLGVAISELNRKIDRAIISGTYL